MDPVRVTSEIGVLRKVLVHAPGPEWDLVPCGPGALEQFLIEDIFVLPRARQEYAYLATILGNFIGRENVLEFEEVLQNVCSDETTKQEIIGCVTALDSLGLTVSRRLLDLPPKEFVEVLVRGAIITEGDNTTYRNLFRPIPNLLFTRDLGAAIPEGFIICHAAEEARRRETLLMRYLLRSDLFRDTSIIDVRGFENAIFWNDISGGPPVSIEGGDIIVLDEKTLMVGTGERTTEVALEFLLDLLYETNSPVRMVIRVILPKERASMHLDTVFTVISEKEFMIYRPVIENASFIVCRYPYEDGDISQPMGFEDALREARLDDREWACCGNETKLFQTREQWTDGANLFAISPGLLLGYDRNRETVRALGSRNSPYRYLHAVDDIREIEMVAEEFRAGNTNQRIIIGLPGSELSRARGGPRCMTMPLLRDAV